MKVLKLYPPVYKEIVKRFPAVRGQATFYCWGDKIYNPRGIEIPPQLIAHEEAHSERQLRMGVLAWWDAYLNNGQFRLEEELIGHRAEYCFLRDSGMAANALNQYLKSIANRLSGDIYGKMIDFDTAYRMIGHP